MTVLQFNNKILKACHEAVELLEAYAIENKLYGDQEIKSSDQELAHVINLSGKQRMLTQRIALYAVAKTYGIGEREENLQHYTEAVSTFTTAFGKLMACSQNSVSIDEEYNNISKEWGRLETVLGVVMGAPSLNIELQSELLEILEKADSLLFRFDEIVFLYERQKDE